MIIFINILYTFSYICKYYKCVELKRAHIEMVRGLHALLSGATSKSKNQNYIGTSNKNQKTAGVQKKNNITYYD